MTTDYCKIFGQFAGQQVSACMSQYTRPSPVYGGGRTVAYRFRVDKTDPVLKHMLRVAAENGLKLRIAGPIEEACSGIDLKRVNISLVQAGNKWVISPDFRMG